MKSKKVQQRKRIRAGYGQQPWIKVIAFAVFAGLRRRILGRWEK